MRKSLSLLAAGVFALGAAAAGAATPRAAEDPSGEVSVSNTPLPRAPVTRPALQGAKVEATAARKHHAATAKPGKKQPRAGTSRHARKKR